MKFLDRLRSCMTMRKGCTPVMHRDSSRGVSEISLEAKQVRLCNCYDITRGRKF